MYQLITTAYGKKAKNEAKALADSFLEIENYSEPVALEVVTSKQYNQGRTNLIKSRLAKTNLAELAYADYVIYLDADTRIQSPDIYRIFDMLQDGFDLVISPSQHSDFWHIDNDERRYTFDTIGYKPVQLQGGVFGFTANDRVKAFFKKWQDEYKRYQDQDQAALIRALYQVPLKTHLVGYPFNSSNGSIVKHMFGRTR
jgi:glycosyltransferase involved in cell wall biosynthesis